MVRAAASGQPAVTFGVISCNALSFGGRPDSANIHKMLPIRWTLPVGGVLLAIALLALSFNTPSESWLQISNAVSVRWRIIDWGERPEWRQYSIITAIQRRADELSKLRDLPDTSIHTNAAPADSEIARPPQTVPLDIAEPLSIEFPVSAAAEQKPKSRNQARSKSARHVRHPGRAVNPGTPQTQNVVAFPFGTETTYSLPPNTNSYFGNQPGQAATPKANNHFGNQTWQTPRPAADIY